MRFGRISHIVLTLSFGVAILIPELTRSKEYRETGPSHLGWLSIHRMGDASQSLQDVSDFFLNFVWRFYPFFGLLFSSRKIMCMQMLIFILSLSCSSSWSSDVIWQPRSGPIQAQVIAHYLWAFRYFVNQCRAIIKGVPCHLTWVDFNEIAHDMNS